MEDDAKPLGDNVCRPLVNEEREGRLAPTLGVCSPAALVLVERGECAGG